MLSYIKPNVNRFWSEMLDSNQRPSAPKADALPDCANLRIIYVYVRGVSTLSLRPHLTNGKHSAGILASGDFIYC
jgi:hypothetical protein